VAKVGGASVFLHFGPQRTPELAVALTFQTESGTNEYCLRLAHAAGDDLVFSDERFRFSKGDGPESDWFEMGAGHRETRLLETAETGVSRGYETAGFILSLLRGCVVYQFHNTSPTARIKQRWSVNDDRYLKEDGANLAPVLRRLGQDHPTYYRRIVDTIRLVAPFFADFELETDSDTLLLQYREQGSDMVLGAHQLSDGTLRAVALITLLLGPPDRLPPLILIDEPELGLHPAALSLVADLIKAASRERQVLVATQSAALLDEFDPGDVIVAERIEGESTFRRLRSDDLEEWLEVYSLSALWDKNVLGGRP
jgi:predicted ATPase